MGLMTKRDTSSDQFDETDTQAESAEITTAIKEKFGHNVIHLDLGITDDAKIIESATPSTQFQQFIQQVIQLALSSLDIPYSFYDGTKTNYYGTRGALDNYIESCVAKQSELIEMLHEITDWRLRLAIMNGELPLPPKGMPIEEVLWNCDWIGARMPHWRLIEDAKGYLTAIQTGLLSPQQIAALYGNDFNEVIQQIAIAHKTAKELGVILATQSKLNIGV
jgi:capsid protein